MVEDSIKEEGVIDLGNGSDPSLCGIEWLSEGTHGVYRVSIRHAERNLFSVWILDRTGRFYGHEFTARSFLTDFTNLDREVLKAIDEVLFDK